jgi:hypothetical protein
MTWKLSPRNNRSSLIVETGSKAGWFDRVRETIHGNVLLVAEAAGAAASAVGVPLAAVTGKLYLAVLVALFGLGCGLRFVRLRRKRRQPDRVHVALPHVSRAWLTPVVGLLSAIEVALLVEATRLPVRADQPGFDTANWWWVLAGFAVLFWLQRGWLGDRLHAKARQSH